MSKVAVLCEVLVICVCLIQFATGGQYIAVNNDYSLGTILDTDASIFIFSGIFSILASVVSLILMRVTGKNYHTHNASYFLTLLSFCLQVSVAVVSACYTTIHEQQLSGINNSANNITTLVNLELAQAVLSFVIVCPCMIYLLQIRWQQWALFLQGFHEVQPVIADVTIKEALR